MFQLSYFVLWLTKQNVLTLQFKISLAHTRFEARLFVVYYERNRLDANCVNLCLVTIDVPSKTIIVDVIIMAMLYSC